MARWRRRRAVRTLSEAKGLRPRKVVCAFSSASGMVISNLAIHSSANELLTTSTPEKSSTTRSSPSSSGINLSRTCSPNWRVPRFSPKSLKLNVTIVLKIEAGSPFRGFRLEGQGLPLLPIICTRRGCREPCRG